MSRKKKRTTKKARKKINPVGIVKIPAVLLRPVGIFLSAQIKKLERRKKDIEKEDPFKDSSRVSDNASPDTDAQEQFGHARTSAIKEQLDRKIIQTKQALARIRFGKYGICEDCGNMIDTDRLMIKPEATLCTTCKAKREK